MITPLRTRVRWMRNQIRRSGTNKMLIVDNRTYCLNCLKETDCTMYCDNRCRKQYACWKPDTTPKPPKVETVVLISEYTVRKEEGLDRPPAPHVCDTSRFGYCVPCRLREIREGRDKKVMLTDEATRTRTRNNYRKHQPAARAGGGD
jgi:hypothetical protein